MQLIEQGHCALAGCAVCYLIWWWIYFRPEGNPSPLLKGIGVALILGAFALGVLAVYLCSRAFGQVEPMVPLNRIWLAGIVAYLVLALVTRGLMGRPITTELFLIVGWLALEMACASCLASTGSLAGAKMVIFLLVTAALFVSSMVCYCLYYRLDAWPGFIAGCILLVGVGITSLVLVALLYQSRRAPISSPVTLRWPARPPYESLLQMKEGPSNLCPGAVLAKRAV